ncbi:sulfotransferase [Sphingomonas naphthae]|uniref:Sulfotransferase n=1 Tax=Sphingomonas naphthae TaxID=1813468 RepID=A0ABY7TI94_9SPHN|nr:sulfotransferase [Sphingomonas naphthae]WCT72521.1 sulfotransferase [Sphingomonas naphthae]
MRLVSDIHERAGDWGLPMPLDGKRRRRLGLIRQARILFVHVPKNGGMSACAALYGEQIKHGTIRYYDRVAPDLRRTLPSVAVLRDPVDRFLSAYDYGRAGGSADNRVSLPFRDTYRGFASIDAALDHVEQAANPYQLDHIYRPQYWYVSDARGQVAVDHLLLIDDLAGTLAVLADGDLPAIPHINRRTTPRSPVTDAQADRIRTIYRRDQMLYEATCLRAGRYDAVPQGQAQAAPLKIAGGDVITSV